MVRITLLTWVSKERKEINFHPGIEPGQTFVLGNGLVLSVLDSQSLGPVLMPRRKFVFPFFPSSPVSA